MEMLALVSMFPNGDAGISIEKEQEKFTSYSTMDEKVWQLIKKLSLVIS